jgi:hypothetical protein
VVKLPVAADAPVALKVLAAVEVALPQAGAAPLLKEVLPAVAVLLKAVLPKEVPEEAVEVPVQAEADLPVAAAPNPVVVAPAHVVPPADAAATKVVIVALQPDAAAQAGLVAATMPNLLETAVWKVGPVMTCKLLTAPLLRLAPAA